MFDFGAVSCYLETVSSPMKNCVKCGLKIHDFGDLSASMLKQICPHCKAEQVDGQFVGFIKVIAPIALFFLVLLSLPSACKAMREMPPPESWERGE